MYIDVVYIFVNPVVCVKTINAFTPTTTSPDGVEGGWGIKKKTISVNIGAQKLSEKGLILSMTCSWCQRSSMLILGRFKDDLDNFWEL